MRDKWIHPSVAADGLLPVLEPGVPRGGIIGFDHVAGENNKKRPQLGHQAVSFTARFVVRTRVASGNKRECLLRIGCREEPVARADTGIVLDDKVVGRVGIKAADTSKAGVDLPSPVGTYRINGFLTGIVAVGSTEILGAIEHRSVCPGNLFPRNGSGAGRIVVPDYTVVLSTGWIWRWTTVLIVDEDIERCGIRSVIAVRYLHDKGSRAHVGQRGRSGESTIRGDIQPQGSRHLAECQRITVRVAGIAGNASGIGDRCSSAASRYGVLGELDRVGVDDYMHNGQRRTILRFPFVEILRGIEVHSIIASRHEGPTIVGCSPEPGLNVSGNIDKDLVSLTIDNRGSANRICSNINAIAD